MKELQCTWCQKVLSASEVKIKLYKNEHGSVAERRCPHCNKVLAAYLNEEKGFLAKIRTF